MATPGSNIPAFSAPTYPGGLDVYPVTNQAINFGNLLQTLIYENKPDRTTGGTGKGKSEKDDGPKWEGLKGETTYQYRQYEAAKTNLRNTLAKYGTENIDFAVNDPEFQKAQRQMDYWSSPDVENARKRNQKNKEDYDAHVKEKGIGSMYDVGSILNFINSDGKTNLPVTENGLQTYGDASNILENDTSGMINNYNLKPSSWGDQEVVSYMQSLYNNMGHTKQGWSDFVQIQAMPTIMGIQDVITNQGSGKTTTVNQNNVAQATNAFAGQDPDVYHGLMQGYIGSQFAALQNKHFTPVDGKPVNREEAFKAFKDDFYKGFSKYAEDKLLSVANSKIVNESETKTPSFTLNIKDGGDLSKSLAMQAELQQMAMSGRYVDLGIATEDKASMNGMLGGENQPWTGTWNGGAPIVGKSDVHTTETPFMNVPTIRDAFNERYEKESKAGPPRVAAMVGKGGQALVGGTWVPFGQFGDAIMEKPDAVVSNIPNTDIRFVKSANGTYNITYAKDGKARNVEYVQNIGGRPAPTANLIGKIKAELGVSDQEAQVKAREMVSNPAYINYFSDYTSAFRGNITMPLDQFKQLGKNTHAFTTANSGKASITKKEIKEWTDKNGIQYDNPYSATDRNNDDWVSENMPVNRTFSDATGKKFTFNQIKAKAAAAKSGGNMLNGNDMLKPGTLAGGSGDGYDSRNINERVPYTINGNNITFEAVIPIPMSYDSQVKHNETMYNALGKGSKQGPVIEFR